MCWHGCFLSPYCLQAWLTLGARRLMGARAKSKVLTGAPSYALAWMISDPMHSCATIRTLCWPGSPLACVGHRVLKKRVKGWLRTIFFVGLDVFPPHAFLCHYLRSLLVCLTPVAHWPLGAPTNSKVVTGAPSYALALTFSDPVHSCATIRALCWLGRFPTPCIPMPPFSLFAGLSHPWRAPAIGRSSKK